MYRHFGTQKSFASYLGIIRQEVNKYHQQKRKTRGAFYPVYFPLHLFNKCVPLLDKDFLIFLERNVAELRARIGLSVYNPVLPLKESEELYRILAHMLADGSAGKGKTPYYANTCFLLRKQFKQDLIKFGRMRVYERKPLNVELVYFPKVITDILAFLFDVQFTYPNRIPKLIFTAKKEFKTAFLQAIFDDEGAISTGLTVGIHNYRVMVGIKTLINSLGICTSKIQTHPCPGKSDKIYLSVLPREYDLFQREINFSHPEKRKKLELAIRTRNRKVRTRHPLLFEEKILNLLEIESLPTLDIANELRLTIAGVLPHLKRMQNEGLLIKTGYKNKVIWNIA